jgi:stage V sporulation protein G
MRQVQRYLMEITEIRMFIVDDGKLKATLSATFDDEFVVKGIKVIEGRNGVFVAMPSRRKENGEFDDIAHPINKGFRTKLQATVLEEYHRLRGHHDRPAEDRPRSAEGPEAPPAD